mgnify:CR=1 FL=1
MPPKGGTIPLSRKGVKNNVFGKFARLFKRENTAAAPVGSARISCTLPAASYGRDGACIATVYRCVRLLSESVAMLPLRYLESDARGIKSERDRWMNYLLQVQPNENYSAFDFMRLAVAQILVSGNAYIMPVNSTDFRGCDRLVLLSPGVVPFWPAKVGASSGNSSGQVSPCRGPRPRLTAAERATILPYFTEDIELLEKVTGESWSTLVGKRVLDPLGMKRTISTSSVPYTKER